MRTNNPNPTPTVATPYLITLVDHHHLPMDHHNLYDITIDSNYTIQTLLTSTPDLVDDWFIVNRILSFSSPIIGLHIERSPSNSAATLTLCINNFCLVYQIIHSPYLNASLSNYLSNPNNRFVGVGAKEDIKKLLKNHDLHLANYVNLHSLAAYVLDDQEMLRGGINTLAERVLRKTVKKPHWVSMSRWDNPWLSAIQVKFATVDAFVSFEIGRRLYSHPCLRKPSSKNISNGFIFRFLKFGTASKLVLLLVLACVIARYNGSFLS